MLTDAEACLGRRVVAGEILAQPLLHGHAERRGGEAEDKAREPESVHAHSGKGRGIWGGECSFHCDRRRERRIGARQANTGRSGVCSNFAEEYRRLRAGQGARARRLEIMVRLDEECCKYGGEKTSLCVRIINRERMANIEDVRRPVGYQYPLCNFGPSLRRYHERCLP